MIRTLLSARLLNFTRHPISDLPIMRLKLFQRLVRVIDERKARTLATTILCSEAEAGD